MKVSVIIVNFNTRKITVDCVKSLLVCGAEAEMRIFVVDNASRDGSVAEFEKEFAAEIAGGRMEILANNANLGFSRANNLPRGKCAGQYVLFLNSDTIVHPGTLAKTLEFMDAHPDVGALSCRLVLGDGKTLDRDARRAMPTPWVALSHFLCLDRIFKGAKLFDRYWCGYVPENKIQEVDVIQGAFFLAPKKILDLVGWFDEDYFLDGEDIDLCWKIKNAGYKIIYYPEASITHFKGSSKGKKETGAAKSKISYRDRLKYVSSGARSMKIFYRKRMWGKSSLLLNYLVLGAINILIFLRTSKVRMAHIFGKRRDA